MKEPFFLLGIPADQIDQQIAFHGQPGAEVEAIPEGNNHFTLKIVFPSEPPPPPPSPPLPAGALDWTQTRAIGSAGPHTKFPGGLKWAYDGRGVTVNDGAPMESSGKPVTCTAILGLYGREIFDAAMRHNVPPELIVMTIATETGSHRNANFTGPDTFRWEAHISDYSAGPMQTLGATARGVIKKFRLAHQNPPTFANKQMPPPKSNPLYDANASIDIGTAYIASQFPATSFDPILVAAAYNAGSIRQDSRNPWRLKTFGEHLNRSAEWFGDACALLAKLRQGQSLDTSVVKPPPKVSVPNPQSPNDFVLNGLSEEEADEEQEQFELSGAAVRRHTENDGSFKLEVDFPSAVGGAQGPVALNGVPAPDRKGYVICVSRQRNDVRGQKNRTVGVYQAFFDGKPVAGIQGVSVEPRGPGNNGPTGVKEHRRLEPGYYPLFTHERPNRKYRTLNYAATGNVTNRPWPSIRIEDTDSRTGVLVHCAGGFMMSIGCVNLASTLASATSDIAFDDSRKRVIAVIDSMKTRLANFPNSNNRRIENAWLQIVGDP